MSFKKYIKAVATGPKGNKDLTIDETADAIEQILLNKVKTISQLNDYSLK